MVPLIDVVFLLLIFFIMTVNFRQQEGFLAAELPAETTSSEISEVEPLEIYVNTLDNGSCQVALAGRLVTIASDSGDFQSLAEVLKQTLDQRRRNQLDPVLLINSETTSWQHMMNVYDVLLSMNHQNIIFSGN